MPTLDNLLLIDDKDLDTEALAKLKKAYVRKDDDGITNELPTKLTVPLRYPYDAIVSDSIVSRMPPREPPPGEEDNMQEESALGQESKWSTIDV